MRDFKRSMSSVWLQRIPKLFCCLISIRHLLFLACPVGITPQRTSWKADQIAVIQKCFCLVSRSCFKHITNDRAKHTMWKYSVIKLMRDFFFFFNNAKYSTCKQNYFMYKASDVDFQPELGRAGKNIKNNFYQKADQF